MREQHIVAFDVDSVLFPINEAEVLPAVNRSLGLDLVLEDIQEWDYPSHEIRSVAFNVFRRPDLYDDYWPEPIAWNQVQNLRSDFRVIAITQPFPEHATSKWRYLQRWGFQDSDIVFTGDKRLVDFDVIVEDGPLHAERVGPGRTLVFDRPWNRYLNGEYVRVDGWGRDNVNRAVRRKLGQFQ